MKKITSKTTLATLLAAAALAPSALQGAAVVYEGFTYPADDTLLAGNPGGTGLSGNWGASGYNKSTGLTYGSLSTSGDSSKVSGGWSKAEIGVTTSAPYTALLADGGEMWFSMLMEVGATGNRSYFALSSRGVGASNGDLNGDAVGPPVVQGVGVGFGLASNGTFYANVWDDAENGNWGGNNLTTAPDGNVSTTTGTATVGTHFLVGHIQWGANGTVDDTITLYMPGTDLTLGSAVSVSKGIIANQGGIATLGFQNLTNFNTFDEISIGASSADIGIIPEPSAALLGGIGLLFLLRRHR